MSARTGLVVRRRDLEAPPLAQWRLSGAPRWVVPRPLWRSLGTFCVDTTDRVVSLTYDDGPHPEHTPRVLDVLATRGARATFFVLEGPVRAHPDIVRRIVAEGHEVALHGPDHGSLLSMSTAAAVQSIRSSRDAVESVAGHALRLYRPPYGQHTTAQARAIARDGLELAIWSGDAQDWRDAPESEILEHAWNAVHPGAVILLHDDRADPERLEPGESLPTFDRAAVLDGLLSRLAEQDYRCMTMGSLLDQYPRVRTYARERSRR